MHKKRWETMQQILFCMVVSYRPVMYAHQSVDSLDRQGIARMDGIGLLVVDVDGTSNNMSSSARVLPDRQLATCYEHEVPSDSLPNCKTRQSTLDVTASLELCAQYSSGWVVLIEDDVEACTGAVLETVQVLSMLDTSKTSMARFSKFSRALAIPSRKIKQYSMNARSRLYSHPYDVTIVEEWDPPGGLYYVHARNLFHHIGEISTDTNKNDPVYVSRYRELRSDYCWEALS
jgi:hypothetical protein